VETFDSDLKYLLPLADSRNLANLDQKLKKFLEQQATFSVSQARLLAIDAAGTESWGQAKFDRACFVPLSAELER